MLKNIIRLFINYFCPPQKIQEFFFNEIYFKELLIKSNEDFINSLGLPKKINKEILKKNI